MFILFIQLSIQSYSFNSFNSFVFFLPLYVPSNSSNSYHSFNSFILFISLFYPFNYIHLINLTRSSIYSIIHSIPFIQFILLHSSNPIQLIHPIYLAIYSYSYLFINLSTFLLIYLFYQIICLWSICYIYSNEISVSTFPVPGRTVPHGHWVNKAENQQD